MTRGGKIAATLFALVFAVPFGGVGVVCAWAIAHAFIDSHRATGWVLVQARVEDAKLDVSRPSRGTQSAKGMYRYTFQGKEYSGKQLGFNALGGSDNIGDWHESMVAFLDDAKRSGKTIPVFVNPDDPAEAVVDRDVRWALVMFMGVFVAVFGGVGVGALYAIGRIWSNRPPKARAKPSDGPATTNAPVIRSGARGSAMGLWVFTILWNLVSFPIAILMVPEMIQEEEWAGLLVLLFPLIGVLMLWGAIAATVSLLRRGTATLALGDSAPRMGARMGGAVSYARVAGRVGKDFQVRLIASRYKGSGNSRALMQCWSRDLGVRAVADPRGGLRLPFQFDVPAKVKGVPPGSEGEIHWRVAVKPPGASTTTDEFALAIQAPREPGADLLSPGGDAHGPHDEIAPDTEPTPEERRNTAAMAQLFGKQAATRMTPEQRAALAKMSPKAQAAVGMLVTHGGTLRKAFVAIAVLFVLVQIGSFIATLFAS